MRSIRLKIFNDNDALRRFVRAVQQVARKRAPGAPMVSLEAGEAVVQAFVQAFLLALAGIVAALLIILQQREIYPVGADPAFAVQFVLCRVYRRVECTVQLCQYHCLAAILGLGIDSSLHMVHRSLNNEMVSEVLIHTSTARAIFSIVL